MSDALIILELPLHIVLENPTYDGFFIKSIAKAYSSSNILKGYSNNWIINEGEGGSGGIENTVNRIINNFNQIPQRIFVLRDSDSRYKNQLQIDVCEIKKFLDKKEISYHILNKREIENYIPIKVLENYQGIEKQILSEFKNLSEEQKDYFDLNDGFTSKNRSDKEKEFYNNWTSKDSQYKNLRKGFGKKIIKNIYKDVSITKQQFLSRCSNGPEELKNIINKIEELL